MALTLRGLVGVLFGLVAMSWRMTLGEFALLFGAYVFLDGVLAVAAGLRDGDNLMVGWTFVLEGMIGVALGVLVWAAPGVPRWPISFVAIWAILTGALELIAAGSLARWRAGSIFVGLAGISSVVLGMLLLELPVADAAAIQGWLGIYALVFGAAMLAASLGPRRRHGVVRHRRSTMKAA
ncbi:MAG: DUF308 domain-containing protein [Candidatus Rokubacteria bacterium]|nr:DUF308 domain-containing protein [Candidatus Rokubacteria bacterium]